MCVCVCVCVFSVHEIYTEDVDKGIYLQHSYGVKFRVFISRAI